MIERPSFHTWITPRGVSGKPFIRLLPLILYFRMIVGVNNAALYEVEVIKQATIQSVTVDGVRSAD